MTLRERWEGLSGRERGLLGGAIVLALLVVAYYGALPGDEVFESGSVDAPWVQVARIENYRRVLGEIGMLKQ